MHSRLTILISVLFLLGSLDSILPAGRAAASPEAVPSWQTQIIDANGNVGQSLSLAFQPGTDKPYISYYDVTNKDLKLAFPVNSGGDCGPNNAWSCNSLKFQNTKDFGLLSSIAFNKDGSWGIAYTDNTAGTLSFRGIPKINGTEAFYEAVDGPSSFGVYIGSSLRFNYSGVAHIAYVAVTGVPLVPYLRYASYVGLGGNCGVSNAWQCDTITQVSFANFNGFVSLAFYNDLPLIAYRDANNRLALASYIGGGGNCGPKINSSYTWNCEVIDNTSLVGGYISLYTDTNNHTGIAYIDQTSHTLRYAAFTNNGSCGFGIWLNKWTCYAIDTVGSPLNTYWNFGASIAYQNGAPIIAYNDTDDTGTGILKVAYPTNNGNCGPSGITLPSWQCDVVDNLGASKDVGQYASLAVTSTGKAYIAYYNTTDGQLKLANQLNPPLPPPPPPKEKIYLPVVIR